MVFAGFSSVFNMIQPHILISKLIKNFGLDFNIVDRIFADDS